MYPLRFENHRRSRYRISKKSTRCDNFDNVFVIRFRFNGFTNLHGGFNAEMHQEFS